MNASFMSFGEGRMPHCLRRVSICLIVKPFRSAPPARAAPKEVHSRLVRQEEKAQKVLTESQPGGPADRYIVPAIPFDLRTNQVF
jgi:hypothetical protein